MVTGILRAFPPEFIEHIELHRLPAPATATDPQTRRPR
jgi:hypothetical protein